MVLVYRDLPILNISILYAIFYTNLPIILQKVKIPTGKQTESTFNTLLNITGYYGKIKIIQYIASASILHCILAASSEKLPSSQISSRSFTGSESVESDNTGCGWKRTATSSPLPAGETHARTVHCPMESD